MKSIYVLLMVALFLPHWGQAQNSHKSYFQGFDKSTSGFAFEYHSPLPDVTSSLLARATKDFHPIEWQTEALPENFDESFASFIWLYGMDTDSKRYNFDLYVNGEKCLTFKNPASNDKREWSVESADGATLTFRVTMIDKHKDQMGFAILQLPQSKLTPGKSVHLKIDGEDAGSNIWCMTFKTDLGEKIDIAQDNVVFKEKGSLYHIARFDFTHLGIETKATVTIDRISKELLLKPGHNALEFKLATVEEPTEFIASIKIGKKTPIEKKFTMQPVQDWTVYLVQHTHTDIGYTRPQTEILPEHLRYIDYALDFCDQTDDYPDNAKFRWTCEASWPVREYLKSRPQSQIDRLVKRINEGRIEVTGMFFNYSEIADETILAAQTKTLFQLQEHGISVSTAMQNDVNGIGWCLADYFQGTGVTYLIMGEHGHRARVPFDKPTAFWWESPSGNRLLAYRSEHYMHGNVLGLTSGDISVFRKNLTQYLHELSGKGYPFQQTALQFSGYITDNAPPSTIACDVVREWDELYEQPKLRIATAREFMNYVEKNHSDDVPVYRVAWPDWWTDGAGSAMQEAKAVRTTQCDMIANTGLFSMAAMMGAELPENLRHNIEAVQDALLFYDEHTYGAAESISDPLAENSVIQWNEKAAYAWEAVKKSRMLRETAMGFMQPFIEKSSAPSIAIFNTLNWHRSGLVTLYIDHEMLPNNKEFSIADAQGAEIAAQALDSRNDGTYWGLWAEDIPAMGYKVYHIKVKDEIRIHAHPQPFEGHFENEFYALKVDRQNGVISSLVDKELHLELLDQHDDVKMGRFIYEELANRHQMERFTHNKIDTVYVPLDGQRFNLTDIKIVNVVEGPVWKSLNINGQMLGCADERGVDVEIRLYNKSKRLELHYSMHKLSVTTPEAAYVAFPFALPESQLYYEAQGGLVSPGINQLEGTSADWNTIQNFAAVRNGDAQIVFGSNDAPLVQFGAINTGRFYYTHQPQTSHIYSWVLNNYWTTNFKASQNGGMTWSYYITSSANNSNSFATRFGWESRIPFLTRVLPAGQKNAHETAKSLINIKTRTILLVSAQPALDGDGIILHLRETEGQQAECAINNLLKDNKFQSVIEVNVLEEEIRSVNDKILLQPFETKFLKLYK